MVETSYGGVRLSRTPSLQRSPFGAPEVTSAMDVST